jgi:protein-arginine kinase activator protein McsA
MNAIELADYLDQCVVGNENDVYKQAVNMLRKQAKEIEYWKEMFEKAMSVNEQIRHLEAQVYGGTTK